jgi:GDP-L-fucose synthase
MIDHKSKIFVAGHKGLVGSAILRKLKKKGFKNILTAGRSKLDLTNQSKVYSFIKKEKPNFIFICTTI